MFKKKDSKKEAEVPLPNQRGRGKSTIVIRMPYRDISNSQQTTVAPFHCYFSGHSPSSVIELIQGLLPTNATPEPKGNELRLEFKKEDREYTNSCGFVSDLIDGMHNAGFAFISKNSHCNICVEYVFRSTSL